MMMISSKRVTVSMSLETFIVKKLNILAKVEKRSRSRMAEMLIEEALELYDNFFEEYEENEASLKKSESKSKIAQLPPPKSKGIYAPHPHFKKAWHPKYNNVSPVSAEGEGGSK